MEGKVIFHLGGIGKVAELKAMISHYHLHDIIDFKGWIGESEKEKLFREADAFILPSYNEGMPVCILEAMSFGLPILATRVGGIPEIMEHGVNGYLFNKADKEAMLQAIMCYVNDPSKLQEQGQHSYQLVQRFFPQQVIPLMEDIYRSFTIMRCDSVEWMICFVNFIYCDSIYIAIIQGERMPILLLSVAIFLQDRFQSPR